jgi:hypothetical protein
VRAYGSHAGEGNGSNDESRKHSFSEMLASVRFVFD